MDPCCEVCLEKIKAKNKHKHFKSKSHHEFDDCKYIILSYKNIDIDHVDEAFYSYNIEHNKKIDCYIIKFVSDNNCYLTLFHFWLFKFNPHKFSHKN